MVQPARGRETRDGHMRQAYVVFVIGLPMNAVLDVRADPLAALEQRMRAMPPVAALGVRVQACDVGSLTLSAPLARNLNDKGSAFGGSQSALLTLAAWALTTLRLGEWGREADVYVQDSSVRFLAPLHDDLEARAWLAPGQDWEAFFAAFVARGKARIALESEMRDRAGRVVTRFEGRFVALPPND